MCLPGPQLCWLSQRTTCSGSRSEQGQGVALAEQRADEGGERARLLSACGSAATLLRASGCAPRAANGRAPAVGPPPGSRAVPNGPVLAAGSSTFRAPSMRPRWWRTSALSHGRPRWRTRPRTTPRARCPRAGQRQPRSLRAPGRARGMQARDGPGPPPLQAG